MRFTTQTTKQRETRQDKTRQDKTRQDTQVGVKVGVREGAAAVLCCCSQLPVCDVDDRAGLIVARLDRIALTLPGHCKKTHLFLSFPYVCPEPVLAK